MRRTRIKYCGFTRVADVRKAVALGIDALGFVMWPGSRRGLGLEALQTLTRDVPAFVSRVGLFVDPSASDVEAALPYLDLLQFHGEETPEYCEAFGRPWIKALRMQADLDLEREADRYQNAKALLLDAYRPGVPGGTGETFDWSRIPASLSKPVILAGGLSSGNVQDAIRQVAPFAVDVSGGIEQAAGIKDSARMEKFARSVNSMGAY